jgi:hypothetical protein
MNEHYSSMPSNDTHLPIAQLPATALQALYHAVTGKTENLTKRLTKSVIIRKDDVDRLVGMLRQQMQHYVITAGPTTTVKLIYANKQSQQFSSWERFGIQDASTMEITSDLTIKIEFLLQLPDTTAPQRCVITVDIDSKLPIYSDDELEFFPVWVITKMHTILVSIDFVDYLIAKVFCQVVDDWFRNIPELKSSPWARRIVKMSIDWEYIFDRLSLIGMAGFISTYVMHRGGDVGSLGQIVYLLSVAVVLLSITTIGTRYLGSSFSRVLNMSTLPSMIVLTKGDEIKSKKIIDEAGKTFRRMSIYSGTALAGIILNIIASYLYSWLTK